MAKFIKVKNGTGEGDLVLRTKLVLKIIDVGEGRAKISYGDDLSDAWELQTASTAAEVLEAMEGKEQSCPVHFTLQRRDGNIDANPTITVDWRHGIVEEENVLRPMLFDEYKKLWVAQHARDTFPGLDHLINNSAEIAEIDTPIVEPARPIRCTTYTGGKTYEISFGPDGIAAAHRGLEQDVNPEYPVGAAKPPICTCGSFAGNADCPTHGIGTAWHDLHRGE